MARMRYEVLIRDERTMTFEVVALAALEMLAQEIASNIEYEAGFATIVRRHRPAAGAQVTN